MTISLCMIVKNEEETLGRCLDCVKDIVDEIIIVDTGSDDNTKNIALKYTDKVYDFEWIDDFSAARNYAFSKATMEYQMWLDADDVLLEEDRIKFKNLKENFDSSFDVVMMKYNLGTKAEGSPTCTFMRERLLKREKGFIWHDPIHEYIIINGKILNTDICVTHKKLRGKSNRNLKIFEKMIINKKELSDRNKFYYARELFLNKRFEEAIKYYELFLDTSGCLTSNYMDASIDLASCYRFLKDDKNVLRALLRSFEHDSPRAEVCCQIGFYYKQKQDYNNALFWYDIASKIKKPENQWGSVLHDFYDFTPNMELSSCYYHLGNLNMAIKYNNIASTFKPDDPMVKHNKEFFNKLCNNPEKPEKKKVLVGSPVYQKPNILKAFLDSLDKIVQNTIKIDFMFVDDNADKESSKLLEDFKDKNKNVIILQGKKREEYVCDDKTTHKWTDNLALKVANFKNKIIDYAVAQNYDYMFFIDSDIIIHPYLIEHLKNQNKKIISEIFWTQFNNGDNYCPNVWMVDQYGLAPRKYGEELTTEEIMSRTSKFLNQLLIPGVYEVGGLGACTLIDIEPLKKGVSFEPIKNLTIPGEDRFFCIRAIVLGFDLFVDTHYPAYHIYREENLEGVENYVKNCKMPKKLIRKYKQQHNKLTLSMIVKNESHRYIRDVLSKLDSIVDEAVIINDASTDNTVDIIYELLPNIPIHIITNEKSMFENEVELRKKQWNETLKTNPDWILNIDADEIFENSFYENVRTMINQPNIDLYSFKLYDMWDKTHYREDKYWSSHKMYRPFLLRYQPDFTYKWLNTAQHCGRFPLNIFDFPNALSEFRVKHYGWAKEEDRLAKYKRYKKLDPSAIYGDINQYETIIDKNPNLIEWNE